jgi:serine phosphatase RsbU (regulator of sigma subunit)
MSVNANNLLNQIVVQEKNVRPVEILRELHEGVRKILKQEDPSAPSNDGMETGIFVYHTGAGTWEYAGAAIYLVRMAEGEAESFHAGKLTIGDKNTPVERFNPPLHAGKISPGQGYFLYSDGIIDQFGGPKNKKFLQKRLYICLKECDSLPFDQRERHLVETLEQWRGSNEQTDDQLLIALYF